MPRMRRGQVLDDLGRARQGCGQSAEGYCVDCAPGRFIEVSKNGVCTDCPAGRYQQGTNKPVCIKCGPCAVGNREGCGNVTAGYCAVCYPGRYSNVDKRFCSDCPAQYYQFASDRLNCIKCPEGKYQNDKGEVFCTDTPSGMALQPKIDGATGKVMRDAKGTPLMERVICPAGKFSTASSAQGCEYCEQGKVQPQRGKSLCEQCSVYQYIKLEHSRTDNKTCIDRPLWGVDSDGETRRYTGDVWHRPEIVNPNVSTKMYTCVNDGCPDKGATVMECKHGYHGPLCAVCGDGFFLQLRACKKCEASGPSPAGIALFVISLLFVIALATTVFRHRRFLASTGIFGHVKILVAFVTIILTVDRQFGVTWPPAFQQALAALSVLSLDFGILTSLLCMVNLSFYANLLCTT
eukprot:g2626.t1